MRSQDAIHSIELFSPSTTNNMQTSGLSELKEIVDSLQVSLQQMMSLGQCRVSPSTTNCTSLGSVSLSEESASISVEIKRPVRDVMNSISESSLCMEELSEILEEDEEPAELVDNFHMKCPSDTMDSVNANSAVCHSQSSSSDCSIELIDRNHQNLEIVPCSTPTLCGQKRASEQLRLANLSFGVCA